MSTNNDPIKRVLRPFGPLIEQLREKFRSLGRTNVQAYYEVGEMLLQQRRKLRLAEKLCDNHQTDLWEELGERIGVGWRTLYDCCRFAEVINDDQLRRLLERNATWTKIRSLFSAPPELMDEYVDRLVRDDPDETELRRRIRQDKTEATSRKPRSPRPPRNLNEALDRLFKDAGQFIEHAETVIFGEKYDLAAQMLNEAPDSVSEELLERSEEAAELLERVAAKAAADAAAMRDGIRRFDEVLRLAKERDNCLTEQAQPVPLPAMAASTEV